MPDEINDREQGQGQGLRRGYDLRPVPDPTVLTTAALAREIASLKELTFTRIEALERALDTFSAGVQRVPTEVDKGMGRLQELMGEKFASVQARFESVAAQRNDKFETIQRQFDERDSALHRTAAEIQQAITTALKANQEILDERFASIQTQFNERDVRVETTARDTRVAVDAALQAAEKAVGKQNESFALSIAKSEAATQKQIDQQGALLQTAASGLSDKIDDTKDRLTRLEGRGVGATESKADTHSSSVFTTAIIGVALAIISALIAAAALLHSFAVK